MLVPQCPLSNLYSHKAVVGPDPARMRQGVPGGSGYTSLERGGAGQEEHALVNGAKSGGAVRPRPQLKEKKKQ